jgi:hypothetical protein
MALFNTNASAIGEQLGTTAAGRAAQAVAQSMSPRLVQDVQRVLKVGNIFGQTLGLSTGIGAIDNLLSLGDPRDTPTPLLGGLTLRQAQGIYEQVKATRVAKKNLFFLRIKDENPPKGAYPAGSSSSDGLGGVSKVGPAAGVLTAGISGAVSSIAGALGFGAGDGGSISSIARNTFDLLALDVSYGESLLSDSVQIGSGFIDRPTGSTETELQITTMDDEAGSLKRWFIGKKDQVAKPDGTFGLPWEYLVTIEVVHAIPSDQVEGYKLAYSKTMRLRPQGIQLDLSRREQAVSELQLTFSQFDSFMGV